MLNWSSDTNRPDSLSCSAETAADNTLDPSDIRRWYRQPCTEGEGPTLSSVDFHLRYNPT